MSSGPRGDGVEVRPSGRGVGLCATRDLPAGTAILRMCGAIGSAPDRHSIQLAAQRHLQADGQAWAYLNHSCAPNCRIEFGDWTLVAVRDIRTGEELTFDYLTTEWDMAAPFQCACGAPGCRGQVRGFRHLSPQAQARLAPRCSPYLVAQLAAGIPANGPCR